LVYESALPGPKSIESIKSIQINQINQTNQTNQINQINQINWAQGNGQFVVTITDLGTSAKASIQATLATVW